MKNLKYVGHYDRQSYVKADFTRHGVPDEAAKAVAWDVGDVQEVSDEVAEFLDKHHPGNFVEVDEDGLEAGAERSVPADSNDDHNNITLNEEANAKSLAEQVEGNPDGAVATGGSVQTPTGDTGKGATTRGTSRSGGSTGRAASSKSRT